MKDLVKRVRNKLGLTCSQFAIFLGLYGNNGERRVRTWESGKEKPNPSALIIIKYIDKADLTDSDDKFMKHIWELYRDGIN